MRIWAWVAGILAGVGLLVLIGSGADGRNFSGRDRSAIYSHSAMTVPQIPAVVSPDQAIGVVLEENVVPTSIASSLGDIQLMLATAAKQTGDEAKATYQQAYDQLQVVIDQVNQEADDTSNDATQIQLIRLSQTLENVQSVIEAKIVRL
jgi:hypothetical protein